jgi:hypothetical protein
VSQSYGDVSMLQFSKPLKPTAEALETLRSHSSALANVVRTQLIDDTGDGHGISEELRSLSHLSVLVERIEVSRIQICIPACHVHENLLHLRLGELELLKESPASQVMVVLVGLSQNITNFQMCLVVVCPMLLAAVDRYPAVWALEVHMGRWGTLLGRLASLQIHGVLCGSCRLMIRMRTVCMLSHERCSLANLRYRRVRERIEQIVLRQDKSSFDTLWIDILERLEWLLETAIGRSREVSSGRDPLWLRKAFGGMISL